MLDADGVPVGPAVMALDTRATEPRRSVGSGRGAERIYGITGLPAHPAHPLIQLLWLRHEEPDRYGRVARVLCWEEYVALRLGLPAVSDPSVAARTMAWDVAADRWSDELLDRAVVSPRLFPEVRPRAAWSVLHRSPSPFPRRHTCRGATAKEGPQLPRRFPVKLVACGYHLGGRSVKKNERASERPMG